MALYGIVVFSVAVVVFVVRRREHSKRTHISERTHHQKQQQQQQNKHNKNNVCGIYGLQNLLWRAEERKRASKRRLFCLSRDTADERNLLSVMLFPTKTIRKLVLFSHSGTQTQFFLVRRLEMRNLGTIDA